MDTETDELFGLCKKVYEKTGWSIAFGMSHFDANGNWTMRSYRDGIAFGKDCVPLYTSDYLLAKLPSVIQDPDDKVFKHILMWINGDGSAHAGYVEPYAHDDKVAYSQESDTMLKTLLSLALELKENNLLTS